MVCVKNGRPFVHAQVKKQLANMKFTKDIKHRLGCQIKAHEREEWRIFYV